MIRQCSILFGCLALGELIVYLTGIKLPSSIIGMLLLTLFLQLGWIKLEWVQGLTNFLVANLGFFFVPSGVALMHGNCVVRIVHGAKCDVLPSRAHKGDTSMYVTHYAAGFWISGSRGRCVLRSGYTSNANSGLACAGASHASSSSSAHSGARLAFRGKFVIIE